MMENNQSMSMDRNFFREGSWNDTNRYGNMQDLGDYSDANSVWRSGASLSQDNGQPVEELYKELTDFIPMVQSFMDIRSQRPFTHQAPVIFTPRPPRGSSSEKVSERKAGKITPTCAKKQRASKGRAVDNCKNMNLDNEDNFRNDVSHGSSRPSAPDKENISDGNEAETLNTANNAELLQLRNQVEDLEKRLGAKEEELLNSTRNSADQIEMMQIKVEELHQQIQEKDSLIKTAHLQLCYKKNELADARSLLKKAEEDSKASNQKIQKLEDEINRLRSQITVVASFFETLEQKSTINKTERVQSPEDPDVDPSFSTCDSDFNSYHVESIEDEQYMISEIEKREREDIEQARRKYLEAVITAKNNPGEESLSLAADLRLQLQQFLLRPTLEIC